MIDITGKKKVSKRDVRDFIAHIERKPLRQPGKAERCFGEEADILCTTWSGTDGRAATAYASRGAFQILIDFFDGFDKLLDKNINVNSVIKLKMHHKKKKIRTILTRRDF